MQTISIALGSILLYVAASARILASGRSAPASAGKRLPIFLLLVAAVLLHAALLATTVLAQGGFDLGFFNAASLAGWFIGAIVLLLMAWRQTDSLAVVIFPAIALVIALALGFPSTRLLPANSPLGLQFHVVLSMLAYALFALAAVQAIYLGIAEYKLRNHRPSMEFLPPLPTMESLLFQLTACAFALLTVSLLLGAAYIADISAQHLAHKIVFSLLAWLVFASLLIGRWRFAWRGRRAIKFVIAGFVFLALGFFGTKAVLELILHRV